MTDSNRSANKSSRFWLKDYLGISDISEMPTAWFPKLRIAQRILCSLQMCEFHPVGANFYEPAVTAAEIMAHNHGIPVANHWIPHPDPEFPAPLAVAATGAQIENHRNDRRLFEAHNAVIIDLIAQTADILGGSIREQIESDHPGGLAVMSNAQLQTWLYNRYGTPTESDLIMLRNATNFTFTSAAKFGQDAAKLKSIYTTLTSLGAAVNAFDQMRQLEMNVSHIPHVVEAVGRYKIAVALALRTFDGFVNAILQDLQRLLDSSATTVPNEHPRNQNNGGGRGNSGGRGRNSNSGGGRSNNHGRNNNTTRSSVIFGPAASGENTTTSSTTKYCFAHGERKGHTGMECRLMMNDPRYTLQMRQASGYCVLDNYHGAPGGGAMSRST
jgi:hypothetical protein